MLGLQLNSHSRVLVINDSKDFREVIAKVFQEECPEAYIVAPDNLFELPDIEKTLKDEPYNFVVLDESLPKWEGSPGFTQNGIDLIPKILAANPLTVIIFVPERNPDKDDEQVFLGKGATVVAPKKFFLDKLFSRDAILPGSNFHKDPVD